MSTLWSVRLASRAEQDLFEIVQWSATNFGQQQAVAYAETLSLAIGALAEGPEVLDVKRRDEIGDGILTLHVARQGRKGRHFVVFRVGGASTIDVLRLLHDSMDLVRHVK
ncbi:MAG: type II toxin-antitoxin system RelE/ParE family toxin [Desulfuromonadales bacterium]|nr:type II toxin-antitoxin system RelE/ParE family toxin [Desulfuromonadales bacterium]